LFQVEAGIKDEWSLLGFLKIIKNYMARVNQKIRHDIYLKYLFILLALAYLTFSLPAVQVELFL